MNRSFDGDLRYLKLSPGLVDMLLRDCWKPELHVLFRSDPPVDVRVHMDQDIDSRTVHVRVVVERAFDPPFEINQIDLRYRDRPDLALKEFALTVKNQLQLLL